MYLGDVVQWGVQQEEVLDSKDPSRVEDELEFKDNPDQRCAVRFKGPWGRYLTWVGGGRRGGEWRWEWWCDWGKYQHENMIKAKENWCDLGKPGISCWCYFTFCREALCLEIEESFCYICCWWRRMELSSSQGQDHSLVVNSLHLPWYKFQVLHPPQLKWTAPLTGPCSWWTDSTPSRPSW